MDDVSVLQASGLFGSATADELEPLRPALRRRAYAGGSYLWRVNDTTGVAFVVVTGLVKTCRMGSGGRELVVSVKGPLETIGEYHLFEEETHRQYDAVAVQRSECVTIARDLLTYQLGGRLTLIRALARTLLRKLRDEMQAAADVPAAGNIEGRLAFRLLQLADRHGEPADGGMRIPFALSQSLLASLVGSSREHVNRALSKLTRSGMLSREEDGTLILRRLDALRALTQ